MKARGWFLCMVLSGASILQAAPITYMATLSGAAENPPNGSPGTGSATVIIDTVAHTLLVDVSFSGLLGNTTASHIHCCVAPPGNVGVATQLPTFAGFPLGVTAGTYNSTFDMTQSSSWNPSFITANGGTTAGAEAALAVGLAAGRAYLNIHTSQVPAGEIRGFLGEVPEPATFTMAAAALAGLFLLRRRGSR